MKQISLAIRGQYGEILQAVLPKVFSEITVGGVRTGCDYPVPMNENITLNIKKQDNGLAFSVNAPWQVRADNDTKASDRTAVTGNHTITVCGSETEPLTVTVTCSENIQPASLIKSASLNATEIKVGYGKDLHISSPDAAHEGLWFTIAKADRGYKIRAEKVFPGVYIGSRRLKTNEWTELREHDYIFVYGKEFQLENDTLYMENDCEVRDIPYRTETEENSHLDYPHMQRSARHHEIIPDARIEIKDPSAPAEDKPKDLILSLLPSVAAVALVFAVRGNGGAGSLGTIIFSVGSTLAGLVVSVITYFKQKKEQKEKKSKREAVFLEYITAKEKEIKDARENEKALLRRAYPDSDEELRRIREFSSSLFDRTAKDNDFLDVRLGTGSYPAARKIEYRHHDQLDDTDTLMEMPQKLAEQYRLIDDVPVVDHWSKNNAVGILGASSVLELFLNTIILDLTARQFYEDAGIYLLCGDHFGAQAEAYRFFPHFQNNEQDNRNIACDHASMIDMLEQLYKQLDERNTVSHDKNVDMPWQVILIESDEEILNHPIMKYTEHANDLHTVFVFFAQHKEYIPVGCTSLIRLFNNTSRGLLTDLKGEKADRIFTWNSIDNTVLTQAALRLAPVYTDEVSLSSTIPAQYSFYEMLDIKKADSDVILDNWKKCNPVNSLSVPVGITDNDEILQLDIHEKAHGPHGLVAGTTGSGKSEVLICYLLSLAYYFSPEMVNFVIIDFKGGGMSVQLAELPHLIGTITNLDGHEMKRSLLSIHAELIRRQRILAEAKVSNINDYLKAFKAGTVSQPLPHLLLVVDEFAELKAQQPDFMNELISTARIGRSLGVHLILSTQRPNGVVNDQIQSNMDFRLCLRVQTPLDSKEMVNSPLAAEIREPGRGYLQVSRCGLFKLFQSGYTGAPENASLKQTASFVLNTLDIRGHKTEIYKAKAERTNDSGSGEKQFTAVMDAISSSWNRCGYSTPVRLCMPPLSDHIVINEEQHLHDDDALYVGLCDLPEQQIQKELPFTLLNNTLIVGATQTGKTTLLETVLSTAARSMTADEINVYIMDFNSGIFRTLAGLSIVGGVAGMEEEEKIRNLLKMLHESIAERKEKFLDTGTTTVASYRQAGGKGMPYILVMIDNFSVFREVYDEKYEDEILYLLREGPSVGITFAVTCIQSSAVGYRRVCYFDNRIAFYCTDSNEYGNVLDDSRVSVPEIPGRLMTRAGKYFYEAQVWEPFLRQDTNISDTDIIRKFVTEHSDGKKARLIPDVPNLLRAEEIGLYCRLPEDEAQYAFAMNFSRVDAELLDLYTLTEISLIGSKREGKLAFVKGLIKYVGTYLPGMYKIHIIDDYDEGLAAYKTYPGVLSYTADEQDAPNLITNALNLTRERYQQLKRNGRDALEDEPLQIFIFNSIDVVQSISGDISAISALNEIMEKYRKTKVLFVFANIDNRPGGYGAPDLMRHIQSSRSALLFDGIETCKTFDFSASETRELRARLDKYDAFMITDNGAERVRLAI